MTLLSWLGIGRPPKSPELKEAESAFSEQERKDIEAHYNAVYKQLQATYPGGRAAAPKGLDASHIGLLVGPLWGCLDTLLAADVFALLACPDDGLVHPEQLIIAKAKLERLGEDACLDTTFRMLDVRREGALRADALAAGIVSGVRMSLAAAAAVDAVAAGAGADAGAAAAGAGVGVPGVRAEAPAAMGAGAGTGHGGAVGTQGASERAAAAIAEAVKELDSSLFMQQALAVCRGALLPNEPASSSSSSSSTAFATSVAPGATAWTKELTNARMSPDDYRRWTKRCPALHNALAGLLRHVGSAAAAGAGAAPATASGTASGMATPRQAAAGGGGQGRGGGGPTSATTTSSGGSPHSQASEAVAQKYRHELPPVLTQLGKLPASATLLQPVWTWLLSARLPPAQRCEWRLLFSSARDGKSFNTFFGRVSGAPGPTLMLIKDKGGALFGGYALQPWAKSGNFYGDVSCAIFSLLPAVQVFPATGINDNIQWCGVGFSQLPGGLGFGGAAGARGHFALYVEPSLDSGMSRPIATFGNSASLASEQVFQIDTLECWLLQPPEDEDPAGSSSDPSHSSHGAGAPRRGGGGSGSILNKAAEDRVIMKMAGMTLHSEGVRDEPLEED